LNNIRVDAKNVKKEFVKSKFVDAAKSIIFKDGVSSVTARGIAEVTGYSYATMYHYFKDLNELLLETKLSMIRDMVRQREEQVANSDDPLQRMKDSARLPVDFFMENPNVFRFLYLYEMDVHNETAMKSLELEKAYYGDFLPFVEKGAIKGADIPIISRILTYSVFGMITLYLSNNGLKREEIYKDVDNMIDLLLKGSNDNKEKGRK
jgi:AcrR family transcriptional regulator